MKKTYVIAEAGVNHNGSLKIAKEMVDVAFNAGVDAVKFQTFNPALVVSKMAKKADYQARNTQCEETQLEMIKKLSLEMHEFKELKDYCDKKRMTFLSTPFDLESVQFLETFDMPFWKIPSGEITNLPYLKKIASTASPVVLSTGMSTVEEIDDAIKLLEKCGCGDISLLHCNTEYPTPFEDANLNAMLDLKNRFCVPVGYSDHTLGIEAAIAAVALGAVIIEKHFTINKNMEGPDHKASLEPYELKDMVEAIRNVEKALGSLKKKPTNSELKNKDIARKSIVARTMIKQGQLLTEENITTKRPGSGISPMKWFEVLGKAAPRDFEEDELIEI